MREDIYFIISFDIRTDRFDELTSIVQIMVEGSRAEDGCLAYEFSTNKDRTKAYMIEHFRDSAALVEHITHGSSQHAAAFNSHLSLSSFVVVGEPTEELRRLLPPDANYVDRVGGFTK